LYFGYYLTPNFSIFSGPQINLIFKADLEVGDKTQDFKDQMESMAFGSILGAALNFKENQFVDLRFNYGFNSIVKNAEVTTYSVLTSYGLYF